MILNNVTIVNHDNTIECGFIEIENGKIKRVGSTPLKEGIDLKNHYVLPGYIDIHIHGTNGCDTSDGTKETLETIIKNLPKEGTTSFLATTLTIKEDRLLNIIELVRDFETDVKGANLLGIHLEGPFINKKYKGAQNPNFIYEASVEQFKKYVDAADGCVKIMTYAPEKATTNFTEYLVDNNIVPSAGHSAATMDEMLTHVKHGLKNITHFHNGQSGHHHRTPGVVSAGFYTNELNTEIICDGIHLHKDVVKMVYKLKTRDHMYLISDSMRAKNLPDGVYDLGGLDTYKTEKDVRLKDGSLAGSILRMEDAVKNFKNFTDCSMEDLVCVSSYNQAKALKIENKKAQIKENFDADLVILDKELNVVKTIINGEEF